MSHPASCPSGVADAGHRRPGVLVLDDDTILLDMLTETLPALGFTVRTAFDGAEAIRLFRQHRGTIDVVLLDVHVPGLGGPETLLRLRQIHRGVRAVFMTWDTEGYEGERLRALGAVGLVSKPFHPEDVARKLSLALESRLADSFDC
jgi:CheY-like chemotaxis protein